MPPDLHVHSLAYKSVLALQLNSHSATREQAQLREVTLLEENAAYEKAISNCENRIQEKIQEANSLRRKLKEIDEVEKNLASELDKVQISLNASQLEKFTKTTSQSLLANEAEADTKVSNSVVTEELEVKKNEFVSIIFPFAQREKMLNKQRHSHKQKIWSVKFIRNRWNWKN